MSEKRTSLEPFVPKLKNYVSYQDAVILLNDVNLSTTISNMKRGKIAGKEHYPYFAKKIGKAIYYNTSYFYEYRERVEQLYLSMQSMYFDIIYHFDNSEKKLCQYLYQKTGKTTIVWKQYFMTLFVPQFSAVTNLGIPEKMNQLFMQEGVKIIKYLRQHNKLLPSRIAS